MSGLNYSVNSETKGGLFGGISSPATLDGAPFMIDLGRGFRGDNLFNRTWRKIEGKGYRSGSFV